MVWRMVQACRVTVSIVVCVCACGWLVVVWYVMVELG